MADAVVKYGGYGKGLCDSARLFVVCAFHAGLGGKERMRFARERNGKGEREIKTRTGWGVGGAGGAGGRGRRRRVRSRGHAGHGRGSGYGCGRGGVRVVPLDSRPQARHVGPLRFAERGGKSVQKTTRNQTKKCHFVCMLSARWVQQGWVGGVWVRGATHRRTRKRAAR